MSQDIDREKVLQTTKVRTSIKNDLSWIQKTKRAAAKDVKESTELEKDETSPSLRQGSYVLVTAKKFESATNPPQSPKELTCTKEPDTSENILPEPVSPEPTVASTTTEEKHYVESPKSKNSAEISTKVVKEGCENDTFEAYIVNDAASVDESVASMVPDILAESVFKSTPPQENCNEVSKANALDILSDSLVEPILSSESNEVSKANALAILSDSLVKTILSSETKEADANPSSEIKTDQNAYESAETVLNGNTNTLNDDKPAVADLPQVMTSTETLSTPTKEDIVLSKTTTVEVTVVQNDAELAQGEACAEAEVVKEPEVSAISSDTDVPQDNAETKETELTSTKDCVEPGTASTDVKVQNNVGPIRYIEETVEKPNEPESSIATTLPIDKTETEETQSTAPKKEIVASGSNSQVIVVKNDAESIKGQAKEETVEVPKEYDVSTVSSAADVPQDNTETKETYLTSTKEVSGTANAESNVDENNVDPLNTSEGAFEVPKEPEIPAIVRNIPQNNAEPKEEDFVVDGTVNGEVNVRNYVEPMKAFQVAVEEPKEPKVAATITDLPQDNAEPTETQTTSTKLVVVESRATNAEVIEQKAPDITAISSDVSLTDSEVQSQGQPSSNGHTGTTVEDNVVQNNAADQGTAKEVQKTENAISVVDPEVTGQIDEKEKDLEEKTMIDATAAKASLKNPNQAEPSVIPEKEIVTDEKTTEESAVSEVIESEQKAQTETTDDSMLVTETLVVTNENVEDLNKVEENVQCTAGSSSQIPGLAEINQDEIFEAEHVVVESSPVEETSPMVPFVAGENQAVFDISDALDVVPNSEQRKEEGETLEITDKSDEVTTDKTVKAFEELKDSSGEQLPTDNNSAPILVEKEETNSKFIMRDGKEVCSHCDQFIGLIKLIFSYPPMYLHPDCLKCGLCTKILGALLTPMFEHNHRIYCCDCYDEVYSLN